MTAALAPPPACPGAAGPEELLAGFGLREFRVGQRQAVEAALAGRDCLVVMPTGAGKSLCYQLPALAFRDDPRRPLVVVVSPLIALMADQWQRLRQSPLRAAMLASGMDDGHNADALREIESGDAQLVLAAPERFASPAFRDALAQRLVGLFVVDEAHCVAEWGHDFRPDYLRLQGAVAALGRPPVMAATATATPRVAGEIATRLGLRDWVAVSSGFDRPNLTFDVVGVEGKGAVARKRAILLHLLSGPAARPAIVYCGTRRDTESVADLLAGRGMATVAYHAGLPPERRREAQERFMAGDADVVVATNAFGMGIDKADVRTVAHWALPTSLEAYYQEAGRGGRDGRPARALLLAARMDLGRLIRFNTERQTTVDDVRAYTQGLRRRARPEGDGGGEGEEPPLVEIPPGELDDRERVLLSIAERAGAAELEPGRGGFLRVRLTGRGSPRLAWQAIKVARDRGWESYRAIESFIADDRSCRRRRILEHFGDAPAGAPDGRCCDVCHPDPELQRVARSAPPSTGRGRGRGQPPGSGEWGGGPPGASGPPERDDPAEESREPVDEAHYERLRVWRQAQAEGKPAYTVASNAVLQEIIRRRPAGLGAMLAIRGIGPAFCEKHGESLLQVLGEL